LSQEWKEPLAFGIWTLKDPNVGENEESEEAQIDGKTVHCPLCRRPLKVWVEGCSLYHMVCQACELCLTQVASNGEVYSDLMKSIH
jgi:hypothetical protein